MLHNSIINTLMRKVIGNTKLPVRYSALFINGLKATDTYVFVRPHIDYPDQTNKREKIQAELVRRKSNFDLDKLENLWAIYDDLKQRKNNFEKKRTEISKELNKLMHVNPDSDEVNKLKLQANLIKGNIKELKNPLWSAEEGAILEVLKLPNALHTDTNDDETVLYSHLTRPTCKKNHLDIGKELDILTFKKNENYYLKGDAAVFELGVKFYFSGKLKTYKYVQFSNADFVKSVVVEGCGGDHTSSDSTFILHHNENTKVNVDSRLHLTGAGSLCSFFAYHAKNVIPLKLLPLKYFAIGRQYYPSQTEEDSLFHVSQSSVLQIFEVTRDEKEQQDILKKVIDILKEVYVDLGYHFRLTVVPASKLQMWESMRVNVEMFSSSLDQYVEVANVSLSGDYISKRLMFTYVDNKQNKFPHIISGTILNVPKLLGCILEQDCDFVLPKIFQEQNWGE